MKTPASKQLVLSLIKDDVINSKLVDGLNALGLEANHYLLHLSETIFTLMGLDEHQQNEDLYKQYIELCRKAGEINITESNAPLDGLVGEIYERLKGWG